MKQLRLRPACDRPRTLVARIRAIDAALQTVWPKPTEQLRDAQHRLRLKHEQLTAAFIAGKGIHVQPRETIRRPERG